MKLYISGPMTGIAQHNFPAFNMANSWLKQVGYETENPAAKGVIEEWTWEDYLKYDIHKLIECQGIATLNGWSRSKGANLEVHIARALSMPVRPVLDWVQSPVLSVV